MERKGALEEQLAFIVNLQTSIPDHEEDLEVMRELEVAIMATTKQVVSANTMPFNRHCTLTVKDVENQLRDFHAILKYKRPALELEIEYKRMGGVTQAQMDEMVITFEHFDRDASGHIDKKEMRTCLYSLGTHKVSSFPPLQSCYVGVF